MKESTVRDYLALNFERFKDFIINYSRFQKGLERKRRKIIENERKSPVKISELIMLSVIEKMLLTLPYLKNLKLIGKEFKLLETPTGLGKQPAVDLLAYHEESFLIALIELKISDSAEREAITELSAYNQGLHNRFRGLSNLEAFWLPISTEWRTTTKAAAMFSILWQNTNVIPLHMQIMATPDGKQVKKIKLNCFNPVEDLKEYECQNLFSLECFDAFDYCTQYPIKNHSAFVNFITGICNRHNVNGFIIFYKPVDLMFPHGFTLCFYNPYKGNIHKAASKYILDQFGKTEYLKAVRESSFINEDLWDVDFKTNQLNHWDMESQLDANGSLPHDAFWEKDFLAVSEFMHRSDAPNIRMLIYELKRAIDGKNENPRAFGTPSFQGLMKELSDVDAECVIYTGAHLELVRQKISIEQERGIINADFFSTINSISYLKEIFDQYNFQK